MIRVALAAILLSGCSVTSAQLLRAGQWSAAAALASADRAMCAPALRCSGAVQILAAEGAGRAEWADASAACVLPRPAAGTALIGLEGVAGAVAAVADAVTEQLRERAAVRREVQRQATADLATERRRCPDGGS